MLNLLIFALGCLWQGKWAVNLRGLSAQRGWSERALRTEQQDLKLCSTMKPMKLVHRVRWLQRTDLWVRKKCDCWISLLLRKERHLVWLKQICLLRGSQEMLSSRDEGKLGVDPHPHNQRACQKIWWGCASRASLERQEAARRFCVEVKCSLRGVWWGMLVRKTGPGCKAQFFSFAFSCWFCRGVLIAFQQNLTVPSPSRSIWFFQ